MKNKKHLTYHQWIKVWEFGCLYRVMLINWETGNIERRIFTGKDIKKYFRKHWQQLIKPAELSSRLTKIKNKDISVAVRIVEGAWVEV